MHLACAEAVANSPISPDDAVERYWDPTARPSPVRGRPPLGGGSLGNVADGREVGKHASGRHLAGRRKINTRPEVAAATRGPRGRRAVSAASHRSPRAVRQTSSSRAVVSPSSWTGASGTAVPSTVARNHGPVQTPASGRTKMRKNAERDGGPPCWPSKPAGRWFASGSARSERCTSGG